MLHYSWDRKHGRCNSYILFWAIFCPFTNPKNQKWKEVWRYHHFTHVSQKQWSLDVRFLIYGARQNDGWIDGQKKQHIEVGALPKINKWAIFIYESHLKTTKLGYWLIVLNMKNCGKLKWKTEILKKGKVLICKFCKKLQLLELICEKAKSTHNS